MKFGHVFALSILSLCTKICDRLFTGPHQNLEQLFSFMFRCRYRKSKICTKSILSSTYTEESKNNTEISVYEMSTSYYSHAQSIFFYILQSDSKFADCKTLIFHALAQLRFNFNILLFLYSCMVDKVLFFKSNI